ncbi:heterokaryon incompatibility protein-domain-containing protein [Cercophora samala]|uniref:Heterokaryon incompatibility protein-domain-containing protein n=1 Tax=Cercophora samala TaxID=330535 RepID=A0AA40D3G2_9PEZI|nr:heterokaryon incompatibility protein-domain-containing protein [Cercophora samala]
MNGSEEASSHPSQDKNLCRQCLHLNINLSKFRPNPSDDDPLLPGVLALDYDPAHLAQQDLGYLDEIYRRRHGCSLCRLIFDATHGGSRRIGLDGLLGGLEGGEARVPCQLRWVLDGRTLGTLGQLASSNRPLTRRVIISTPKNVFPTFHILPLGTPDTQGASPTFTGRQIPPDHFGVERIKSWLDLCLNNHEGTCTKPAGRPFPTLRLVDVVDENIVELTEPHGLEYATLSYVWGGQMFLMLKAENREELLCKGSLGPQNPLVPQTIRDAIRLTRDLGIRYIWVDSLCIMQSSSEDWARYAALMDKIYSRGVVNICAAAKSEASGGIPGSALTPRRAVQYTASCRNIDLVAVTPVESLIEQTTWNNRAWVFQERMLSPRSIILVEDRIFFQCRGATWSEDIDSESTTPVWTLDMADAPLQTFRGNPLRQYAEYVELYTKRKLTFISDRLHAFSGIAASLAESLEASFIFGLPNAFLDWALLWESAQGGKKVSMKRSSTYYLPTWSWCGWNNAVTWRMSMISGTLINLHEWLSQRTWIVWYTGHAPELNAVDADLVPVWHPSGNPNQVAHHIRAWSGYTPAGVGSDLFGRMRKPPCLTHDNTEKPTVPTRDAIPRCLHFWTYTAHFQLSRRSMSTPTFQSDIGAGLHRFGILDARGDWCGTAILEDTWLSQVGAVLEFAAISEARDFSMEELDTWNYYVPQDKTSLDWYLFYAILLQWDAESGVYERRGLAKIYQDAFKHASFGPGLEWKEIALG